MIITKEQFNNQKQVLGGDLWNSYKLHSIAFRKYPDAVKIEYNLGTGLWCDIVYWTNTGEEKQGKVYERDENNF